MESLPTLDFRTGCIPVNKAFGIATESTQTPHRTRSTRSQYQDGIAMAPAGLAVIIAVKQASGHRCLCRCLLQQSWVWKRPDTLQATPEEPPAASPMPKEVLGQHTDPHGHQGEGCVLGGRYIPVKPSKPRQDGEIPSIPTPSS